MAAHILVVEDHQDTARALTQLLSQDGFRATPAASLHEAASLCRTERFELLLVDLQLPDGDGLSLPELVKPHCRAPAVVMSGHSSAEQLEEARRRGFADYLVKPVEWESLRTAVLRILRGSSPIPREIRPCQGCDTP